MCVCVCGGGGGGGGGWSCEDSAVMCVCGSTMSHLCQIFFLPPSPVFVFVFLLFVVVISLSLFCYLLHHHNAGLFSLLKCNNILAIEKQTKNKQTNNTNKQQQE